MILNLTLDGAPALLVKVDGERFAMTTARAYAPGTPLRAAIDGTTELLSLKVSRSIRSAEGAYEIQGRLINVTRPLRTLLDSQSP